MLIGVAAAFVQKGREGAVAMTGAKRAAAGLRATEESRNEVRQIIQDAHRWASVSLVAVVLAMVSWSVAVRRRERRCGTWAILVSLLAFYAGLQLILV